MNSKTQLVKDRQLTDEELAALYRNQNYDNKINRQYVIYLLSTKSKVCYEEGLNKEEALKTFLYYNPCYIDKVDITTKYGYRKLRHKEKIKLTN